MTKPFDQLIAESSIGEGLRDIAERGIDAHVADLDAETAPARKKGRRSSTSPNARTLTECRKRGWTAQSVERPWNKYTKVTLDLFGVIDIVAIVPAVDGKHGSILAIQATSDNSGGNAYRRAAKILAEPRAKQWVEAGGRLELWSWSKRGGAGKRKLWTLRVEAFTAESWTNRAEGTA